MAPKNTEEDCKSNGNDIRKPKQPTYAPRKGVGSFKGDVKSNSALFRKVIASGYNQHTQLFSIGASPLQLYGIDKMLSLEPMSQRDGH